ncbi:hypothetical protein B0H19DRAFT_1276433 [Mycena capillaripes]|nr:hypothetical protein B0H19DRAFT_1276433 [Mycena capillaripes]
MLLPKSILLAFALCFSGQIIVNGSPVHASLDGSASRGRVILSQSSKETSETRTLEEPVEANKGPVIDLTGLRLVVD